MVVSYMLMVVTTLTINYNRSSTIFMQEFNDKRDCESAIHYIKSSTMADVSATCMMLMPESKDKTIQPTKGKSE